MHHTEEEEGSDTNFRLAMTKPRSCRTLLFPSRDDDEVKTAIASRREVQGQVWYKGTALTVSFENRDMEATVAHDSSALACHLPWQPMIVNRK